MTHHNDFSDRIDFRIRSLANALVDSGRCVDFCEAVQRVLAEQPQLAVTYAQFVSDQGR